MFSGVMVHVRINGLCRECVLCCRRLGLECKKEENLSDWYSQVRALGSCLATAYHRLNAVQRDYTNVLSTLRNCINGSRTIDGFSSTDIARCRP